MIKTIQSIMVADSVIDPESDNSLDTDSEIVSKGSTATDDTSLQKSEYDDFDEFDIDENTLKGVKGFSNNKVM